MFESLLASEQANKAAVLLANERYSAQLAPFVKNSSARLEHVNDAVERIIDEVCEEMNADHDYVSSRVLAHLQGSVQAEAKKDTLKLKKNWVKNQEEVPSTGNIHHTDYDDEGEVEGAGHDEARAVDKKIDLKKDTQKGTKPSERKEGCFRCGEELHEKVASVTPVCHKCTQELLEKCACDGECGDDGDCTKEACNCGKKKKKMKGYSAHPGGQGMSLVLDQAGNVIGQFLGYDENGKIKFLSAAGAQVVDPTTVRVEKAASEKEADIYNGYSEPYGEPSQIDLHDQTVGPAVDNLRYNCTICGEEGTREEILSHVNRDHGDVLQQQQNEYTQKPEPILATEKEAGPADLDEQAIVEPLPQSPVDNFDDMVQDLANRAAAIQFSTLEEKDLNALAETLGLNAQELQGQLQVVAVFDNYTGVNGQLVDGVPEVPEGYQEVQAQNVRATAHEALIPTQTVIQKVAEQMNMEPDLAYNMVRDSYGGVDLPDKYHAAVQGEYHFYVPAQLANNTPETAQQQGDIGPTAYAPDGGQLPQV